MEASRSISYSVKTPRYVLQILLWTVTISAFLLHGCSIRPKGEFGWSRIKREERALDRSLKMVETDFRIYRDHVQFLESESIWWIYQMKRGFLFSNRIQSVLYRKNYSFQDIAEERRILSLQKSGCCKYIRHYYHSLSPGRYSIHLSHDFKPLDHILFSVLPNESANSQ